jgi:hypothetical protein
MDSNTTQDIIYSKGGHHYFGFELRHIISLAALNIHENERDSYADDLWGRQIEYLGCLINQGNEKITIDLRWISKPDPVLYTHGYLKLAIIYCLEESDSQNALKLASQHQNLLESCFPEYSFETVNQECLKNHIKPFDIKCVAEITRRCETARLDTLSKLKAHKQVGFAVLTMEDSKSSKGEVVVIHVYPFTRTKGDFNKLCKMLLMEPYPIIISCRLKPTMLQESESKFYEDQIATCERFAQYRLDEKMPKDIQSLFPTLQEQARYYQNQLAKTLYGLRDNVALVQMSIASAQAIPRNVLEILGALITEPAGGISEQKRSDFSRYLTGGYDIKMYGGSELQRAILAVENVEITPYPHPLLPEFASRILYLFDSIEAGTMFRLPPSTDDKLAGLNMLNWRSRPAPEDLPSYGVMLGLSQCRGIDIGVRIADEDRRRHMYTVGQTGTGKTTLLKTMILSDISAGKGLCIIDPHGDMFKELLGKIPLERMDDVIVFDPTDLEYPIGLNLLECETENQRHFIVQELVAIMTKMLIDEYGPDAAGAFAGPVFYQHMRMNLLLCMSDIENPGTLLEFYNIFQEKGFWNKWLPLKSTDPLLVRWVKQVLPHQDYQRVSSEGASTGNYIISKFQEFVFHPMLRNIFSSKHSTIDIGKIMDEGKILLVNLAKGELSERNSKFLGMILMAKIQAAAMERVKTSEQKRRDFYVYVDEFQSIATQNFVTLLSEGRKFGINMILSNQFVSQIDKLIMNSIFGNVGTIACFRLGQTDAEVMEKEFLPHFGKQDLLNLPNWTAYISTLVNGQTVRPFSIKTLLDKLEFRSEIAERIKENSRKKYGQSRSEVEASIEKSLNLPSSNESSA